MYSMMTEPLYVQRVVMEAKIGHLRNQVTHLKNEIDTLTGKLEAYEQEL